MRGGGHLDIKIHEGFPDIEIIINCPQITDKINKITSALQNFDGKFSGFKSGYTYLIERQNVFYFESIDKRCFIYTADDTFETSLKLYEIEENLTNKSFFRSSKSQIINIAKIKSLCPDFNGRIEVIMENGEKLIVSRQYAKLLKERLNLK